MGGRGASSGISRSGNKYGTEYSTLYQSGNIKFIKQNGNTKKDFVIAADDCITTSGWNGDSCGSGS